MGSEGDSELIMHIASLLERAKTAHRQYEVEELEGGLDEQWPAWYATYLLQNGLPGMLDGMPGRDNLVNNLDKLLIEADRNHRSSGTSEPWPTYYARYFVSIASKG